MNLIPVLLFAFASGITPGPNNTLLLHSGARYGYQRSLPHIIGITLGMVPLFAFVGFFLSEIQNHFPKAQTVLFAVCGAYIIYLSIKIASARMPSQNSQQHGEPWSAVKAAGFQWFNPKVWMMAISVYGSGMGGGDGCLRIFTIIAIFALVCFPTMSIWTLFGTQLKSILRNPVGFRILHLSLGLLLATSWIF